MITSRLSKSHSRNYTLSGTTAILAAFSAPHFAFAQEGQAVVVTNQNLTIVQNGPVTQTVSNATAGIVGFIVPSNGEARTLTITSNGDITFAQDEAIAGIAGFIGSISQGSARRATIIDHTGNIEIGPSSLDAIPQFIGPSLNGAVGVYSEAQPSFIGEVAADISVAGDITVQGEFSEGIRVGATETISVQHEGNITSGEHGIRTFGAEETTINVEGNITSGTAGRIGVDNFSRNLTNGNTEQVSETFSNGDGIEVRGAGLFFGPPDVSSVNVQVDGDITSFGRGVDIMTTGDIDVEVTGRVTTTGTGTTDTTVLGPGGNVVETRSETFGRQGIDLESRRVVNDATGDPLFIGGEIAVRVGGGIETTGAGIAIESADNTTVDVSGGITTTDTNADGIQIRAANGDVNITSSGAISATGEDSEGIQAVSSFFLNNDGSLPGNLVNITVVHDGDIDAGSDGIELETHRGDVSLTHNGDVTANEFRGDGLQAGVFIFNPNNDSENLGIGNASINSTGNVTTNGGRAEGVQAFTGTGNATIVHVGDITTSGITADAVEALVENIDANGVDTGTGNASATVTGNITTTGGDADNRGGDGLIVGTAFGNADATLNGSFNVANGSGIVARTERGGATADVTLSSASTASDTGIDVRTQDGKADLTFAHNSSLTVSGGDGVRAQGSSADVDVSVDSDGSITASGTGVEVIASSGTATVELVNAGTIEGADAISVDAQSGTVAIDNSGTIIGRIQSGGTVDTLTNRGTIDGGVVTGASDDTLTLTAGSALTGNADLGAGNDTATATTDSFDGLLDGGDDIDALTLTGGGAVALGRIINFEDTTLTGGRFTAQGVGSGATTVRDDATLDVASAATTGAFVNEGIVEIADGATLSTDGFTAESGSTTDIGLSSETSGTISSTGAVAFEGGSTIALSVTPDVDIVSGRTYVIATGSSVTDASELTEDSALFNFTRSITGANTLVLTAERELLFADNAPMGSERQAIGESLDEAVERDTPLRASIDAAIQGGATEDDVLSDLTPSDSFAEIGATRALVSQRTTVISDRITGRLSSAGLRTARRAPQSSADTIVLSTSIANNSALAALSGKGAATHRPFGVWAKGYAGVAEQDDTSSSDGFDADSFGIAAGVDYKINPSVVVGIAGSYGSVDVDLSGASAGDTLESDSVSGILYGGVERGPLMVEGQVFYGENNYDGSSRILGNRVTSDYDGNEYGASLRASYTVDTGNGVAVAPEVAVTYARLSIDSYSERGVGGRTFDDADFDSIVGYFGAQVSTDYHSGAHRITPQIRLGLEHEFDGDFDRVARFSTGGAPFAITNDDREDTRIRLGIGLEATLSEHLTVGFDYDGAFASDYDEHTGSFRARFNF